MKAREALKLVAGSVVVYVVMAACGSSSGPATGSSGGGGGSLAGGGGGVGGGDPGGDDGNGSVFDALTDPVPEAQADPYQSGTRLKANYYAGADGSKQFAGWHDLQLNLDCFFGVAADGALHCLPTGAASVSLYYSDSSCTTPLATGACSASPPAYAEAFDQSNTCQSVTRVYPVSGPYGGASYWIKAGATCSGPNAVTSTPLVFFTFGPEIAPSTYVQATVQTEQ